MIILMKWLKALSWQLRGRWSNPELLHGGPDRIALANFEEYFERSFHELTELLVFWSDLWKNHEA